jgi:predicted small secreted protein
MVFRNWINSIAALLAFAAVTLAAFRVHGAGEDVKESASQQLSIAAAADLKFALDDSVMQFEEKYPAPPMMGFWRFRLPYLPRCATRVDTGRCHLMLIRAWNTEESF